MTCWRKTYIVNWVIQKCIPLILDLVFICYCILLLILLFQECNKNLIILIFHSPSAMAPKLMKMIRVEAPLLREIMAEFLGTFILVVSRKFIRTFFSRNTTCCALELTRSRARTHSRRHLWSAFCMLIDVHSTLFIK